MKHRKAAIIVGVLAIILTVLGLQAQKRFYYQDYYQYTKEEKINIATKEEVRSTAYHMMTLINDSDYAALDQFDSSYTNLRYKIIDSNNKPISYNVGTELLSADIDWSYTFTFLVRDYGFSNIIETYEGIREDDYADQYTFYGFLDSSFAVNDIYSKAQQSISGAYLFMDTIYFLLTLVIVSGILAFAYLSGLFHKNRGEESESQEEQSNRVLVLLGISAVFVYFLLELRECEWMLNDRYVFTYLIHPLLAVFVVIAIYYAWKQYLTAEVKEKCIAMSKKTVNSMKNIFEQLSIVKRAAVIIFGIVFLELIIINVAWNRMELFLIIWILEKIILLPILFTMILDMKKIKIAGEELANGNLEYQIKTDNMSRSFKQHGENMNNIADVLNVAIEKRLQSERMKTELITNVSHDIKTPITSIINYAGLIEKEPCDSPKHKEYAEVLVRKATHLKRLLDDLVEASKASTGTIEMKMEDCEANVLLTQVVGEFEQRLEESKLTLVTKAPEEPVMIHVDSKRIWRVFENLLMNACKYSLEGSRVYLNLDKIGDEAIFSFRNTSRAMLNVSAEELMERFVRGDSARSTEGNGLGLSIAKSLTELQNGKMDIIIDGDLFKVILRFPVIS